MRYLAKLAFVLLVALAFCPFPVFAHTEEAPFVTELTADGGDESTAVDVGAVKVWNDADSVYVTFLLDNPVDADDPQLGQWCMTQTHLDAQLDLADIPQTKKHSPTPGRFAYGDEVLECDGEATYAIPNTWNVDDVLYIAAHANVQEIVGFESDLPGFEAALPDQVTIRAINYPNANAYFDTRVSGGTVLDGTYSTWCIDETHTIYVKSEYTANVYSSYEELPASLTTGTDPHIDHPENLDLVNYIINQDWQGQGYTSDNVQNAIWYLIDDNSTACSSSCMDIANTAQQFGEGYEPPCGGSIAVILAPTNETAQVVIGQALAIDVGVPCVPVFDGETAWGGPYPDNRFNKKDWSIWFNYTVQ